MTWNTDKLKPKYEVRTGRSEIGFWYWTCPACETKGKPVLMKAALNTLSCKGCCRTWHKVGNTYEYRTEEYDMSPRLRLLMGED